VSSVPVRPKVVCLCGSLRFGREFAAERTRLTLELAIVLAPEATEARMSDPLLVRALGELHLRRIDLADEVRIVNPGGYIGEATRREIAYAEALGKPVTYFHALTLED
jgi:maleate cis-trans isomerase